MDSLFSCKAPFHSPGSVREILNDMVEWAVPEKCDVSVEYRERIRAAKSEATSSLANNKVPRRREEMVKSYFDSLDAPGAE